jgi:hypothetical protein
VVDQAEAPVPPSLGAEMNVVPRPDVGGPDTVYAYNRCVLPSGVPNDPFDPIAGICVTGSNDAGATWGPVAKVIRPVGSDPARNFAVHPSVVQYRGTWYMVYEEGGVGASWADSPDGLTWTPRGRIPGESALAVTPSLYVWGDRLYLFFAGFHGKDTLELQMRSGTSLTELTPRVTVMTPAQSGWATASVSSPHVVLERVPGTGTPLFYLFYEGATKDLYCGEPGRAPDNRYGWGVARSFDLLHWDPMPANPVRLATESPCGNSTPYPFVRSDGTVLAHHAPDPANNGGSLLTRDVLVAR